MEVENTTTGDRELVDIMDETFSKSDKAGVGKDENFVRSALFIKDQV